jgi:exosortase/archaeosortase family protein
MELKRFWPAPKRLSDQSVILYVHCLPFLLPEDGKCGQDDCGNPATGDGGRRDTQRTFNPLFPSAFSRYKIWSGAILSTAPHNAILTAPMVSLRFLLLVYLCFFEKMAWVRVVLFLVTIPIAIVAGAGRVTITGIMTQVKPELAGGFFHESTGLIILSGRWRYRSCFTGCWGVSWTF